MKILILGGNGFVGNNIKSYLSEHYDVKTASRSTSETNLFFDIHQPKSYDVCNNNYDIIINCIVDYSTSLDQSLSQDLVSKRAFLLYMASLNVHYIEIGSVSSIEENKYLSDYNFSKFLQEQVLNYTLSTTKFECSILRYAQIISDKGQSRKSQGAFHYFVDCFRNKTILTIFGNPNVPRSYMPIDVLVQTVHYCITQKIKGIHNLIMPDAYSANDLISTFSKYIPKPQLNYDSSRLAFEYTIPPCSDSFVTLLHQYSCENVFKNSLLNNEI